ncbi:unnamed protein product [Cylindrotheca closterium]|uniref:BZIP domain-containing protein n=1 Tax=Cylindrotheca closterium TaxID=2856 RepID=A0AAD2G4P4_9STRA|nr:unnamed protein product [Cylindrotheca closterium]
MKSQLDPRKGDDEASLKDHKPSASIEAPSTTTRCEAQEAELDRSGPGSNQTPNDAVQGRDRRIKKPLSAGAEAKQTGVDESPSWSVVKRDRNRLNAQKGRQKQQNQLKFLEYEYARLFASNGALRYQNLHLKGAIQQVKIQRDATKKPPAVGASSAAALNIRLPLQQQTLPSILSQQQLTALLLGNDNATRAMSQGLPFTAGNFASRQELVPTTTSLLQMGAGGGNNMSHAAAPFGASKGENFCCQVFMVYSTLDTATKQLYHGARHHPFCRNCPR